MPDRLAHPPWEEWLAGFPPATPPERVIENALEWLRIQTGAQTAFLLLPDPTGEWVDVAYATGQSAEALVHLRLHPAETLLEPTLTLGTEWWYTPTTPTSAPLTLHKTAGGIHNGLAVPLPGLIFTALGLLNRSEPFTEAHRNLLLDVAPVFTAVVHWQHAHAHNRLQTRMLDWFAQLPHQIGTDLSLQNALNTLTAALRELGGVGGGVWLYNEERTLLLNASRYGACPLPDTLLGVELPHEWDTRPSTLTVDGRLLALTPLRLSQQKVLGFVALALPLQEPKLAEWLSAMAGHFALILHHALLYEQMGRKAEQLTTLYDLSLKLGETYTPLEVLNQVALTARTLVPHDVAVIYVPDPQQPEQLLPVLVMPANDALWNHFPHRQYSLPGYVYSYGTPLTAPDLTENPHNRKNPLPSQFISALAVPLQVANQTYGTLMLLTETPREFSLAEVQLLFTLANTGTLRWHDLLQRLHA